MLLVDHVYTNDTDRIGGSQAVSTGLWINAVAEPGPAWHSAIGGFWITLSQSNLWQNLPEVLASTVMERKQVRTSIVGPQFGGNRFLALDLKGPVTSVTSE